MAQRFSRRTFLASTVAAAAAACANSEPAAVTDPTAVPTTRRAATPPPTTTPPVPTPPEAEVAEPTTEPLPTNPFTLGVASGDPLSESVILWTRLAIEPNIGGGMSDEPIVVGWEVSPAQTFDVIAAAGTEVALPGLAHSVHVDVSGLDPDSWYWYRFSAGGHTSAVGRTRTLPASDSSPTSLTFAFSSCQNYEAGFYAAHRHLSNEDVDLFFWLGDYIYEYGPREFPFASPAGEVRVHDSPEVTDLAGYRNRYAQYKLDPDLQLHHATRPWVITWDDHEVDNDYAGATSSDDTDPASFMQRRAAAYQAWYEHMPIRLDPPEGPDYRIYRSFAWGDLVQAFVLDGRQHRDDQATDGEFMEVGGLTDETLPLRTLGPTAMDPDHTFLGAEQENWLIDGLTQSEAAWNVVAQQVIMHGINVLPGQDPPLVATDTWDGYYANRKRLLEALADRGVENLIVLSGDFHSATVGDIKPDPFESDSPIVATEFMASSISSQFPEYAVSLAPLLLPFNPQIKLFDARKGYTICSLSPTECISTYRAVKDVRDSATTVDTIARFVVTSGTAGAVAT